MVKYAKKGFTKSSIPGTRWGRKIKPLVYIYDSSNLKPGSAVELCSNEKAWVFNSTVLLMKKTDICIEQDQENECELPCKPVKIEKHRVIVA